MAKTAARPVRERLRDDLEERYEKLLQVLEDAMDAEKKYPVWCPNCRHRAEMTGPDMKIALQAAEFFANQGLGRPGQAEQGEDRTFKLVNKVFLVADDK